MAIKQTYTLSGQKKFTFPHPVRSITELRVQYSEDAGATTGTDVPNTEWSVEGLGTRATGVEVIYPDAPDTGTLIIILTPIDNRVAGPYGNNNPPTPESLNAEFDNFNVRLQSVYGGADPTTIDLVSLDTRLQMEETISADHESRISTIEGQNLDPRVTALEANDAVQDSTLANHETRINILEDASYQQTGLPDPTGNALKYLRLNSLESAPEWDDIQASEVQNDSTAAGATVKDALDDHESRLDADEAQIAANAQAIAQEVTDRQTADAGLQSQINGKLNNTSDTLTGTLTVEVPSGVGDAVITKAMSNQDTVHRFRNSFDNDDGYVGFIRSSSPDYIALVADGNFGLQGVHATTDHSTLIVHRGTGFPALALVEDYSIEGTPNSSVNEGTTATFLTLDDTQFTETGRYLVMGALVVDADSGGDSTIAEIVADVLPDPSSLAGNILYPTNARTSSGESVYAVRLYNSNQRETIPFTFVFNHVRGITSFRIRLRCVTEGNSNATVTARRYSAIAALISRSG